MYKNFDVIIIFDAMRYDIGSKVIKQSNLVGELEKVNTNCSTTGEWYKKYWNSSTDRQLISENPMPFHKASGHAARNFKEATKSFGATWLEVNPQKTINLYKTSPVLIHLLPPHLPFIFGKGAKICKTAKAINIYKLVGDWGAKNGYNKLKEYYREQIVNMVDLLYNNLHLFVGQSVLLTSDHGELLGNPYDHPAGRKDPELTEVPYFIINVEDTLINRRLIALGY